MAGSDAELGIGTRQRPASANARPSICEDSQADACRRRRLRLIKESGELLLLGAPRTAGFRFCCPVRTEPRLSLVTSSVRTQLRGNRERLVIVGTCRFERFNGSFRPGKNTTFEYTSILVRPRQEPRFRAFWWSRRVPPPGPLHLFRGIIYRHSRANPAPLI